MNEIMVSIICITYNQESYIRDALNGFVMQKTNFKFEVLIHDDASTDNTPGIIKEFEEKYPDIIKPIYQTENQYSKRVPIIKLFGVDRAKGKYIAYCEGDDYWTDELKLQKQFDVLESHPEVDICAHAANMVCADNTSEILKVISPVETDGILSAEEVILGEGGFVATNSLMYRKSLYDDQLPFWRSRGLDYALQIAGSLRGGMYFLAENMSDYRYMAKNSWTSKNAGNIERKLNNCNNVINMLEQLNIDTNNKFEQAINKRIKNNKFIMGIVKQDNKLLISDEYKEFFKELSFADRLKIRLKAYFPFLLNIKNFFVK